MKRPIAIALTIALSIAIVFAISRSTTDVDRLYVCAAETCESVETEGDSALVQVYNCGLDYGLYTGITVNIKSSTSDVYALTNKIFRNGRIVESHESSNSVVIDRLENDKWVRWRGDDFDGDWLAGRSYAPIISAQSSGYLKLFFPAHLPGRYRITLSFLDALIDDHGYIESTYGEIHSVSFYYDADEWHDFGHFKAAATVKQASNNQANVEVVIDSGDKAAPFCEMSSTELTWEGSTTNCDACVATSGEPWYLRNLYLEHYGYGEDERAESLSSYTVTLIDVDTSKNYDLTLHFAENEDGSGEQYTLTLRLKFDE